ncbi:NAD(P)-dependent glycerol-3-phosphate dehydrogenase [candidate division WOR-3 bacterium]|nr:NAD(P)-dependent glycerol-3-phosphate dehydrogenase [candidate division WOR-3 bacterium]
MKYSSVGIIGAGNWGTTLALHINREGVEVTLFEPVKERIDFLKNYRENKEFLPGHKIPESILLTDKPKELTDKSDFIFFVLPSNILKDIAGVFGKHIDEDKIVASFTKGVDPKTLQRMSEIIEEEIPSQRKKIVAVSGPSIAREVIKGIPTSLVAASANMEKAEIVQKRLSGEKIRVYTSSDIVGVELGGAFKNVYAIASGICDGMELGMNAKAALITRSMAELSKLGEVMGGKSETFSGLSGFGDLIVTSFSKFSRNRTLGEKLGKGYKLDAILANTIEVVEGVRTTESICKLSDEYGVNMPVAWEIHSILYDNKSPLNSMKDLMKRELKRERKNEKNVLYY